MWCYTLLPKILNMSLTAGIVIILVLLARILLKKVPKIFSYALWVVVLFRLLCPISFSSEFSLIGALNAPAATNGSVTYIPADIVHTEYPQVTLPFPEINEVINDTLPQGYEQLVADPLEGPLAIATLLWLFGIAAMLIYSSVSLLMLRRKLIGAVRLRDNIYLADHIATPFVIGVIRPKIFLPSALTEQEQSYIILHEQIHIRRLDHVLKMIAFLALSVHWFNPLVWVAFICCAKDMEMSCDEAVVKKMGDGIRTEYSASLLSLTTGRKVLAGAPLAFGEGNVRGRIKNVLNYKRPRFWIVIFSVVLVTAVGIGLMANPKDINIDGVGEDSDAPMKHIQIEITQPGGQVLTGRVVTDKDSYMAGDIVSVAISKTVSYDMDTLEVGDWVDVSYKTVREKTPQEFVAIHVNTIGDNYPTTFTLIENDKIIRSNTLRNSRIASEMPSLILSGSPEISFKINGVPDTSQYLIIDIGSFGDKIYYAFENGGSYYVGHDNMYEISRETFDELIQYVYKNEIKDEVTAESGVIMINDILYRQNGERINELPSDAYEIGLLENILHNRNEIPERNFQGAMLDEKYAGKLLYQSKDQDDKLYLEDLSGYYIIFVSAESFIQSRKLNYDDPITIFAWEFINKDIANFELNPGVNIIDSKITRIELIETFNNLADAPIDVYALEYRLLPEDLSKVVLAGGMQVDEEGWLKETSSMGQPLLVVLRNSDSVELVGILWTAEIGKLGLEPKIKSLLKPKD